jgi:TFIIF-interacting CTD phosphatase-like protein
MFEIHIYTRAKRSYAEEIVKLLDPHGDCFSSKVMCWPDNTGRNQKELVIPTESQNVVIALDDTGQVSSSCYFILLICFFFGLRNVLKL